MILETTEKRGELYICPTPIGNLEDMTFRAARVLREVDIIAAEDTRHTQKLLNHFEIKTPLVSYHEHNKRDRSRQLMARLLAGENIALVSDAGIPGISDPGGDLIKLAVAEGIRVTPLPGANAALTALAGSGLADNAPFTFIGFLPKTAQKRREMLMSLQNHEYTLIFYEAPHRLTAILGEMAAVLGDRPAVAARELTKKFEEFVRGSLATLSSHFQTNPPRGEFTLVVGAFPQEEKDSLAAGESCDEAALAKAVAAMIADGANKKDAIRKIASDLNLSRRIVYQAVINKL